MVDIYTKLVSDGVDCDDIEISFLTDAYRYKLSGNDISLEGESNKKINFRNKDPPALEDFLMDPVTQLSVTVGKESHTRLEASIRKTESISCYNVTAALYGSKEIGLLQSITDTLEECMSVNSEAIQAAMRHATLGKDYFHN
jgi:hypothetical protein